MKSKKLSDADQPGSTVTYSVRNLKGRVKPPTEPVTVQKMQEAIIAGATKGLKSSGQLPRK
jgi:hypothetical protein